MEVARGNLIEEETAAEKVERQAREAQHLIDEAAPARVLQVALSDTEATGQVARKMEDILDHLVNGVAVSPEAIAWLNDRKARRGI